MLTDPELLACITGICGTCIQFCDFMEVTSKYILFFFFNSMKQMNNIKSKELKHTNGISMKIFNLRIIDFPIKTTDLLERHFFTTVDSIDKKNNNIFSNVCCDNFNKRNKENIRL